MDTDANQRLAVLFIIHVINKLKQIQRTGWIRMLAEKGVRPESVADHSFGVALLGLFAPLDFDYTKCVAMGVVHDLAEGFVGDMPTYAKIDKSYKRMLEQDGIDFIVCGLKRFRPDVGKRINDLWTEYEENKTQEAQYVHGADKIECLGQASEYEETYEDEDFSEFQGLHGKIQFPEMIQWSVHLQQDREARIARKNRSAPVIFVRGNSGTVHLAGFESAAEKLGLQLVWFDDVLERSSNSPYLFGSYMKDCDAKGFEVPELIAVDLLSKEIDVGEENGKSGTLVCGFPEGRPYRTEFQKKIRNTDYTLSLRCSPEGLLQSGTTVHRSIKERKNRYYEDEHTKANMPTGTADKHSEEVDGDGPLEEVSVRIQKAIQKISQHAAVAHDAKKVKVQT